jgi:hypothetical protein
MEGPKIDFVVLWLDSADPEWQKSLAQYSPNAKGRKENARFRDMGVFQYWFRAVEKYAPWVNKVFLITNGKFPDWINKNHPKLELVKHEDFMPKDKLPAFNSDFIEICIHKIKELSEYFVFFNDDMFLNAPIEPDYYFKNGLPCDLNKETYFNVPIYTPEDQFGIYPVMLADIGIINSQFRRWNTVRQSPRRWFGWHLGIKGLIMSCLLSRQRLFVGFSNYHIEQAFLKSIIAEVWEKEPGFMYDSCTRFREDLKANQYLFRYWQFAKNMFYPMKRNGTYKTLGKDMLDKIEIILQEEKYKSICINDSPLCTDEDFEYIYSHLHRIFENKFPQKSSFEI